ncbi:MAG: hypothetical protein JSV27_03780 [Candidatus Bathyarchaeota archaeon]|nr:MAG: hypothetical protein JSV27_03780 [Candidatus Bathyarchaeota archaeon]
MPGNTREGPSNPLSTLHAISEERPGGTPAFMEAHVLKALELLGSGEGLGRQQLARTIRLGEGTVRTLIRRMREQDLLETSRGGMKLTAKGERLVIALKEYLVSTAFPETTLTVGRENFAVMVRSAGGEVRKGIEERDAALIAGAEGATTFVYTDGRLLMPGFNTEIDALTKVQLMGLLEPEEGDVIIVGSDEDTFRAEFGAKSAALKLLERALGQER